MITLRLDFTRKAYVDWLRTQTDETLQATYTPPPNWGERLWYPSPLLSYLRTDDRFRIDYLSYGSSNGGSFASFTGDEKHYPALLPDWAQRLASAYVHSVEIPTTVIEALVDVITYSVEETAA